MKYKAEIDIMPHPELLDPQGKTVAKNLINLEITGVSDVRIGKHVKMVFDVATEEDARNLVENACKKLLSNIIMEDYTYTLHQLES